jgi:poly-beta-hydroxyalkanoate depolymerase
MIKCKKAELLISAFFYPFFVMMSKCKHVSAFNDLFHSLRKNVLSESEKGTYFEELIVQYLKNEASYQDLYSDV